MSRRYRVLIAAPADVVRRLRAALVEDEIDAVGATTPQEAEKRLEELFDLVVVCYVFDETRPYRLVHQARNRHAGRLPMLLVRALPVPLGDTQEAEVRAAYQSIGVDEFVNVSDIEQREGRERAQEAFRRSVRDQLGRRSPA